MAASPRRIGSAGPRPRPRAALALAAAAMLLLGHGSAGAQEGAKNPAQPFPVIQTGGHSGLVHSLVFAGPTELLSAGLDKVVHLWDASRPGELALRSTTRLPAWKGTFGSVYAMALSDPKDGPRLLAVAGRMTSAQGGEIHLYRYPAPGQDRSPAYVGMIGMNGLDANGRRLAADQPQQGHDGAVAALAFLPGTNRLASAGEDGILRVWDLSNPDDRKLAAAGTIVPAGQEKPNPTLHMFSALAITPDGSQILTAGVDATIRLWNAADCTLINQLMIHEPTDPVGVEESGDDINALHLSPDGRWIAVGREDGSVYLIEKADFRTLHILPDLVRDGTVAVDALRFHPQANLLAVAFVENGLGNNGRARRPTLRSWVELRSVPDGARACPPLPPLDNVIHACEFSPDGRRLAYSGGDDRAIRVVPLDAGGRPEPGQPESIGVGRGRSIWNVAFAKGEPGSIRLAFSRTRADAPDPLPASFDLYEPLRDRLGKASREELALDDPDPRYEVVGHAVMSHQLGLRLRGGADDKATISLDPASDKRWWAKLVIPAKDPAAWPLVAVAMENGVGIFQVARGDAQPPTYRMIRKLAGHSGTVYALALSPDRKWLLTGGADQTVRLYAAGDLESHPQPFGARFRADESGVLAVAEVTPFGFADLCGVRAGDRVKGIQVSGKLISLDENVHVVLDAEPVDHPINLALLRHDPATGRWEEVTASTRKHQNPVASLLALPATPAGGRGPDALAADYVFWLPSGHYLTSIRGDGAYLGWHQNQALGGGLFGFHSPPVRFRPAGFFEGDYHKKPTIDRVLRSGGDPGQVLVAENPPPAPAPDVPAANPPAPKPPAPAGPPTRLAPPLRLASADWAMAPAPAVSLTFARPDGEPGPLAYRVTPRFGGPRPAPPVDVLFAADTPAGTPVTVRALPVPPRAFGTSAWLDVEAVSPVAQALPQIPLKVPSPAPPPEPRVQVLHVGASGPGAHFHIEGAARGAEEWSEGTTGHFAVGASPGAAGRRFRLDPTDRRGLADGRELAGHLRDLVERAAREDDPTVPRLLMVYLEAPVLESDDVARGSRILLGDGRGEARLNTDDAVLAASIPASEVVGPMVELSEKYRCRVVLFLDGYHEGKLGPRVTWWPGVKHLTRALVKADVTVVNASEQMPSPRVAGQSHEGAMGRAWLDAIAPDRVAPGRIRLVPDSSALSRYKQAHRDAFEPYRRSDGRAEPADPVSWNRGVRTPLDAIPFAPEAPVPAGRMANAARLGGQKAP